MYQYDIDRNFFVNSELLILWHNQLFNCYKHAPKNRMFRLAFDPYYSPDIGGMDIQKQEIREAVELPLTHFELYKQIGKWSLKI